MSKPEWGVKRTCPNCDARFYDLQRDPVTCPECGVAYDVADNGKVLATRDRRASPAAVKPDEIVDDEDLVETEEENSEDEALLGDEEEDEDDTETATGPALSDEEDEDEVSLEGVLIGDDEDDDADDEDDNDDDGDLDLDEVRGNKG